jgi:hypothetical protein
MKRAFRLAYLLVPLALGCLGPVRPAHAQSASSPRFAFADTTLLRDTLDLHFDRLFPLSDSLRVVPDTLRALSIRYDMSLDRMVFLADSMRVPVDSVGVMMAREQFSPLAAALSTTNAFRYTSTYSIGQSNSNWGNTSDYNLGRGAMFLHSIIDVQIARYTAGGFTSIRQTNAMTAELGWRMGPGLSLGGRANLSRFANLDRTIYNVSDNSSEFQFSVRSKPYIIKGMDSEVNLFTGIIDQAKTSGGKRGLSGDLNGRAVYAHGWFSQSLDGQITGNVAHTTPPGLVIALMTHDLTSNLRGTVALFEAAPVGLNVAYGLRASRVETPVSRPVPAVQPVLNGSGDLDVALRMRIDNDRYLNFDQAWNTSSNTTVSGLGTVSSTSQQTTANTQTFSVDGRYMLFGWALDGKFSLVSGTTGSPRRTIDVLPGASDTVDYREDQLEHTHSIGGSLSRSLTDRLTARISGDVSLDSYDYRVNDSRAQPTYPRDQYNQSYRIEGIYSPSQRFNTGLSLNVARTLFLNLSSTSSSSNSENDSYIMEWRWSAHLMPGLTVTQRNNAIASYDYLTFQVGQNQLSMDYSTVTTLNAVLSPHLTLDVNHNARYQPRGGYNQFPDGNQYFSPGDENRSYILNVHAAYTPTPALSFTVVPEYQQFNHNNRTADGTVPQNSQQTLNFSGGGSLNLMVGRRGRLTGNIVRTFSSQRTISFSGINSSPRSQIDYWNGNLQLSWAL